MSERNDIATQTRRARAHLRTAPRLRTREVEAPPRAIIAAAQLLWVEPGLHSLIVAPARIPAQAMPGMNLPAVYVTAAAAAERNAVELVSAPGTGEWIGASGGSIVLRAPAGGGYVLVTNYAAAEQAGGQLDIELRPIGGAAAPSEARPRSPVIPEPMRQQPADTLRSAVILHIERYGDCEFTEGGWAGQIGSQLRIEALGVRPLEVIGVEDLEYKAYANAGRETPWVSGGRLCGTRGQSLALTGFAIRLAPQFREQFDVVYRGAFFASGPGPAVRNGDPCFAPVPNDPLEAVEIRIVKRGVDQDAAP
ncbi:MAG TPA: hypothetical protein VMF32_25170 [Xanthobacteraceae bacterium]|nr:hypothetical protein [Xanthobacteraceae bacterium]